MQKSGSVTTWRYCSALYNHFFIIYVIVSDDDSTMLALLNYPSIGVWGQFMKSSKGKIDEEISEPSFLAYPSHRVKVVSKHIFSIVNESRAQGCGCTKVDALRLKKYWGCMIKNNMEKQLKSWVKQVRFLLNTCLTVTVIVVKSGASRQDNQKKERHTMKQTTNSAAKKQQSAVQSPGNIFSVSNRQISKIKDLWAP